jgi:hypothetical protein
MKKPSALIFCVFSGCLLLAGCTDADWDHLMSYGGAQEDADVTPMAPQTEVSRPVTVAEAPGGNVAAVAGPAEAPNADFCRAVATQDASRNDFDRATQQRVYAQSYAQCVNIYTH